ncbi:IS1182 family transposase [Aggregatilinea lenta]|uniref:IS1182 family transposase n=1 Tax=Aggregatilinea lenta TaxID=913108 RepID=UPI000E5A9663|nr:IS1182 family transposase [Aggregatilinea lenta]
MSLHPQPIHDIREQTIAVAHAAFPKGNVYMTMRDELGVFYTDEAFAALFSNRGQPAESPWRLALVTIMQFAENLTDRQAADAVRSRIDWKYVLGLELTDSGFHFSVLSDFRARLVDHEATEQLLNAMLEQFKANGLIKGRGKQRTDSTHILAAVRMLNRLEQVGETLRNTLNVLAEHVPEWLKAQVPVEWFERYGARFEQYRLPTDKQEREALANTIGADGYWLLTMIYDDRSPRHVRELAAVQILRMVWLQQFYLENNTVQWRDKNNLPPSEKMIISPYDTEARYSHKRDTTWIGYKAHLTETCDDDFPCLMTHVETTASTVQDVEVVDAIHADLAMQDCLPSEHLLDMGYLSSDILVSSQHLGIDVVGPVRADTSWQAQTEGAFDLTCFEIDWEQKRARCPMGNVTRYWNEGIGKHGKPNVTTAFDPRDCRVCEALSHCTRKATFRARNLTFPHKTEFLALQAARKRQQTEDFKLQYHARAGVEGLISQAMGTLGMRRNRYCGQGKTHLQHVATAAAINLLRAVNWLRGALKAETRISSFAALAA